MIYAVCIIAAAVTIALTILCMDHDRDIGAVIFGMLGIATAATVIIMTINICIVNMGVDGDIAKLNARREALVYELASGIYDVDGDVGISKKTLMTEVREFNELILSKRAVQEDFWVGIFTPDIYDKIEVIEYDGL